MKTRLLIIIGILSIIVISIFAVMWPEYGMVCNKAVVEHLQKYSNVFDDGITYDTYGIEEIGLPFGVHPGNLRECVDFVLEKRTKSLENTEPVFIDTSLLNNNPEIVKRILDYCNSTGVKFSIGLRSSNDTHIITNNTCEWQTIEKYESDRKLNFVLSICEHVIRPIEDEPTSWSNATHYIDTNNCEW